MFRKFPGVCPYCRMAPHQDGPCKLVKGTSSTVNHAEVMRFFSENWETRPAGINEWQDMFQKIYPRSINDHGRSTVGLLEELGELAEAIRVFEMHPNYFLGEAADTFSYLMGIANEHSLRIAQSTEGEFLLETEFLKRFPGLCTQCGSKICSCPAIPQATVGRMAKELAINANEDPFIKEPTDFAAEGKRVAHQVLETLGGYVGLTSQLPVDRGDTNRALILLCLRLADGVEASNPSLAESLRAEAYKVGSFAKTAGTPRQSFEITELAHALKVAWRHITQAERSRIKATGDLVGELGDMLDKLNVLFVACSPTDEGTLRVAGELRAIQESIRLSPNAGSINIKYLPAATIHDLRRALLERAYDIVHFSGHADQHNLVFEDTNGNSTPVELTALAEIIDRNDSIKCVVLNACSSVRDLATSISPTTIGMDETIDDDAAIEFSRGFYDALAAGKSVEDAYREGVSTVKLTGFSADQIKLIVRKSS